MNRYMLVTGVVLNLFFVLACISSAEVAVVERTPQGGTLALTGDYDDASADAQEMMQLHCKPQPYTVLHEERVVIGTRTTHSGQEQTQVDSRGGVVGNHHAAVGHDRTKANTRHQSVSVESDEYELQVTYVCGVAAVVPAPAPPAAPTTPAEAEPSDEWSETPEDGSTEQTP